MKIDKPKRATVLCDVSCSLCVASPFMLRAPFLFWCILYLPMPHTHHFLPQALYPSYGVRVGAGNMSGPGQRFAVIQYMHLRFCRWCCWMIVVKRFHVTAIQRVNALSETRSLQRQLASRLTPLSTDGQWCEGRRFAKALEPPALVTPKQQLRCLRTKWAGEGQCTHGNE